jgi:CRP-like cAMP-binding protein
MSPSNRKRDLAAEIDAALARSAVLGVLSPDERAALAGVAAQRCVGRDAVLFRAGDACPEIQLLLRGRVRLWRLTGGGHVLALRSCSAGELLGQMSALDPDGLHSVNATAEEDTLLLCIPSRLFRAALAREPEAALRLAAVLAQRVRELSDELEAMKFSSIAERALRLLCRLATGRRELRVTHQALAEQVGATRENVTRVLGLLRDDGVIALRRGAIEILDHDRLAGWREPG